MSETELLEVLRKEVRELEDELKIKKAKAKVLSDKILLDSNGVSIGDKIRWVDGGKEWTGIICGVNWNAALEVTPFKKDGMLSKIKKTVYYFTKINELPK